MNTIITIDGMGGGINFEVDLIKHLLEEHGYRVILNNPHPDKEAWTYEQRSARIKEIHAKRLSGKNGIPYTIELNAVHRPWGG